MSRELVYGIHAVESLLETDPSVVIELFVAADSDNARVESVIKAADKAGLRAQKRKARELDKLSEDGRHQGVVAVVKARKPLGEKDLAELVAAAGQAALVLVLDGVTDPHNLGACLRSAAAAGATAVVVPKDRAAGSGPVVRRASAGGIERVPLVVAGNLARCLRSLRDAGVWITGLAGEATESLFAIDLKGPTALILGGEGEGMRRLTREHCDHLAKIPMPGEMESLNVSVAAGISLFEAVRQRSM